MVVARRIRDELGEVANVVTILCDEGEKYLSEYFIPASTTP
jgi:cysteine synthase